MLRDLDIKALNLAQKTEAARRLIAETRGGNFGRIAMLASFGADAAVLLHLVSEVDRATPIIFLDTQMLFQETLDYQLDLTRRFGLSDVRRITPAATLVRREDVFGRLHLKDTDGCCALRKKMPLEGALKEFDGWITGRKRHQTDTRNDLEFFESANGRIKINPLALWKHSDVRAYFDVHDLPRHPLAAHGYASIGCAPCTTPVSGGEDPRAGRWRGATKTECGIHFVANRNSVRPAA